MGGLISWLSGANNNASQVGSYYNNAANNLVNATGSPAAKTFGQLYQDSLVPQFTQSNNALAGQLAAQGITGSGASGNAYQLLNSNDASALAGGEAPLYQQALGQYGNIEGQGAGAQGQAYMGSLSDFYNALGGVGSAFVRGLGSGSNTASVAQNPYQNFDSTQGITTPGYGTNFDSNGGTGITGGLSPFYAPTNPFVSSSQGSTGGFIQQSTGQYNPYTSGS